MNVKKHSKKIATVLLSLFICLLLVTGFTLVFAEENNYVPKYEKPDIGEIKNEDDRENIIAEGNQASLEDKGINGYYPDERSVSTDPKDYKKEWYEYLTYCDETTNIPIAISYINEHKTQRVSFYDPANYSYGMISDYAILDAAGGYGSQNQLTISYKETSSFELVDEKSDVTVKEDTDQVTITVKAGILKLSAGFEAVLTDKVTDTVGHHVTTTKFSQKEQIVEKTFYATYFNDNGNPYPWTLAEYTISLPIKCVVEYNIDGDWIPVDCKYALYPIIKGIGRTYEKATLSTGPIYYFENWATGEDEPEENFLSDFLTVDELIKVYENNLLPENY